MNNSMKFRGHWISEAIAPVSVLDHEKAESLIFASNLRIPERLRERALLSAKEVRFILSGMRSGIRREFESLLSGGGTIWREVWENLVVDTGKSYILDSSLSGGTPITSWFVFIIQAASTPESNLPTIAAGNTPASHAGWTEVTAYDEATREAWTEAGVSSLSVTNAASRAEFTISANTTYVSGAGLISNSTKGGTTGTLLAVGAFGAVRTLNDNEIHRITAAISAS